MQRYGTSAPNENAEIVSLRVTVAGIMKKPPLDKIGRGNSAPPKSAFGGRCKVWFNTRFHNVATFRRAQLLSGNRISGPALIEEHASTTVLMPGDRMMVDDYGNLIIRVAAGRR
jgi:N-methylhydantoinase A